MCEVSDYYEKKGYMRTVCHDGILLVIRVNSSGGYRAALINTWATKSVNAKSLSFSGSANAEPGKNYRLYVSVSAQNSSGDYETATDYVEKRIEIGYWTDSKSK